jgi:hypothetical protein
MKRTLSILSLILIFNIAKANTIADTVIFPFGENTGYYGSQFTDQNIYDMMYTAGARAARPFLSLQQWITYGISPFAARFNYPYQTKGMRNNVFTFYIASPFEGGGSYTGQSTFITAGGNQSTLPATLWDSVFTITGGDTTINTANLYAQYVASVYNATQGSYTFFEPFNEPDLNNDWYNSEIDSSSGNYSGWATVPPSPDQLINIYDSMKNIVRMYKVTYQTIHFLSHHNPAIQICAGGMSLRYFLRQFLKAGGGQWIDNLSIHNYPYYFWTYYTALSPIGPGNQRYSDMLLRINDSVYNGMQVILGQNTYLYPQANPNMPHCITETNEIRWNYSNYQYPADLGQQNKYIGNDHVQRNYMLKAVADFWRKGFLPIVFFQTGDAEDSGVTTSGNYHNAEGIYPNLDTSLGPPGPKLVPSGVAIQTMQRLLGNYTNCITAPGVTATGNLPINGTDGIQVDSAGFKGYLLWTQTNKDSTEVPSTLLTYNFGTNVLKQINWDGSSPGNVTGTVTLTGDATFFMSNTTSIVANAGSNQTITLPLDSVLLNGTLSTGGTSFAWSQLSGPNTATLRTASAITTIATNMIAGTYVFQLQLNGSSMYQSTVTITVNSLPPSGCNCVVKSKALKNYYYTVK